MLVRPSARSFRRNRKQGEKKAGAGFITEDKPKLIAIQVSRSDRKAFGGRAENSDGTTSLAFDRQSESRPCSGVSLQSCRQGHFGSVRVDADSAGLSLSALCV